MRILITRFHDTDFLFLVVLRTIGNLLLSSDHRAWKRSKCNNIKTKLHSVLLLLPCEDIHLYESDECGSDSRHNIKSAVIVYSCLLQRVMLIDCS